MKNLIIVVLSSVFLFGCATDNRIKLAEGDVVRVLDSDKTRCKIEWTRGAKQVAYSDGLPPRYHYDFRRDIWINNNQITDLGVKDISKGDVYRFDGGELIYVTVYELRADGTLVPTKKKPN
jgi:hypothetical protein